ncbi:hypothetical protein U1Q18_042253 [Sarracenia purpurea var. burkii]
MDVMKSPVSLCTGVTYDRSGIQTWLDNGHKNCPATMQILPSTDFIPNLTRRRFIDLCIEKQNINRLNSLSQIADFATYSDENRSFLARTNGFISTIFGILKNAEEIKFIQYIMTVFD